MARRDSHAFLAGITLLALTVGPAAAQDAPRDPARQYPLPTYEENWQFLRDPNRHADPWDAVKYVLFGDNVYASFGGDPIRAAAAIYEVASESPRHWVILGTDAQRRIGQTRHAAGRIRGRRGHGAGQAPETRVSGDSPTVATIAPRTAIWLAA